MQFPNRKPIQRFCLTFLQIPNISKFKLFWIPNSQILEMQLFWNPNSNISQFQISNISKFKLLISKLFTNFSEIENLFNDFRKTRKPFAQPYSNENPFNVIR